MQIAIDIGGTFTDVVAGAGNGNASIKVLTTASKHNQGAMEGIDRILQTLSLTFGDITAMTHVAVHHGGWF